MDKYDFSGWATRNDLKCSDGRIIRKDAFKHNDGTKVPLVWNHDHTDPYRVIGHALLENRDEGVYAYGAFNDTELGQTAKAYVLHGDITALSIYANQLKQQGPNVMHGSIREVSLVLAGANPGAYIENVIKHGEFDDEEARIFTGMDIELCHADKDDNEKVEEKGDEKVAEETKKTETSESSEKEETIADVLGTLNEKQEKAVYALIGMITSEDKKDVKHADVDDESDDDDDIDEEDFEAEDMDDEEDDDEIEEEDSKGGKKTMKHNVFEGREEKFNDTLSHSEMVAIFKDAQTSGSLKQSVLSHGIENIGELFPEPKNVAGEPPFLKREDTWVTDVLNGVHHTPFARIKSMYADITAEQARAKGYTKGGLKVEEVIKAFKRVTNPTTIYKKQKLDRDDILDITEFSVVAWLKKEMRMMLNEEVARAVLFGDGREEDDTDKINEENIRPIWKDSDVYTVKQKISVPSTATDDEKVKAFIKGAVKSRKFYKGSGSPAMYMPEDLVADCLLVEDLNGRRIYDTVEKLAAAMGVKKIVPVPLESLTRTVDGTVHTLAGLYVNLVDYNIGTDKGGEINFFDDFDIDYNAQKYLMETRCSGALTKPAAAVALEFVTEEAAG